MTSLPPDPADYLGQCEVIDTAWPAIVQCANRLRGATDWQTAKQCFEFVRDQIAHSVDFQRNPVTCRASDVLTHGTGYCYAKSHLLCALLRANGVPAGLCYQRLSLDGEGPPYCLHGLNAVYLTEFGWYRLDARGNRGDIAAQFSPPVERLAFPVSMTGERDLPGIYRQPLPQVVECLTTYSDWRQVYDHLPDVLPEATS